MSGMSETIEISAAALTACASVFAGVRHGVFSQDDYTAIWESLPEDARDYVLEMAAANQMPVEDNS